MSKYDTELQLIELYGKACDEVRSIDEALRHFFSWQTHEDLAAVKERRLALLKVIRAYEIKTYGRIVYKS
jgi:hypothetical protein